MKRRIQYVYFVKVLIGLDQLWIDYGFTRCSRVRWRYLVIKLRVGMKMFVMATIMKTFHKLHRRQLDWKCLTRVAFAMTAVCLLSALLLHVNLNRETFNRSSVDETRFQEYDLVGRLLGRDLSLGKFYACIHCFISSKQKYNIQRYTTKTACGSTVFVRSFLYFQNHLWLREVFLWISSQIWKQSM